MIRMSMQQGLLVLLYPGGEVCVKHAAHNEIVHSHELHVRTLLAYPWHAILHSCLCAVLVLGSATCNTENSMFIIPGNGCIVRAIVVLGGVGVTMRIARNFCLVWRANSMDIPTNICEQRWKCANLSTPGTLYWYGMASKQVTCTCNQGHCMVQFHVHVHTRLKCYLIHS